MPNWHNQVEIIFYIYSVMWMHLFITGVLPLPLTYRYLESWNLQFRFSCYAIFELLLVNNPFHAITACRCSSQIQPRSFSLYCFQIEMYISSLRRLNIAALWNPADKRQTMRSGRTQVIRNLHIHYRHGGHFVWAQPLQSLLKERKWSHNFHLISSTQSITKKILAKRMGEARAVFVIMVILESGSVMGALSMVKSCMMTKAFEEGF